MGAAAVHPTDQTLNASGLGMLDDVSLGSVGTHLESCPSCQRRVAELSSDSFLDRAMGQRVRTSDAKGRVSLPKAFANATVVIEQLNDNELRIRKARVIPVNELRFAEESPIVLSTQERQRFVQALDRPPKPNAALRRLMSGKARSRG
jgi:hypothetical protein